MGLPNLRAILTTAFRRISLFQSQSPVSHGALNRMRSAAAASSATNNVLSCSCNMDAGISSETFPSIAFCKAGALLGPQAMRIMDLLFKIVLMPILIDNLGTWVTLSKSPAFDNRVEFSRGVTLVFEKRLEPGSLK